MFFFWGCVGRLWKENRWRDWFPKWSRITFRNRACTFMSTKPSSSLSPLEEAVEAAKYKKALDIVLLDLEEVATFTDHFLICSGTSSRQGQSIADEVEGRRT